MPKFPIVIYLDQELTEKVRSIQKKLFDLTGSRACLDLWMPHITIGSEVEIEEKEIKSLEADIKAAIVNFKPFKINIKNFCFMDNWSGGKMPGFTQYVIYLNVIVNDKLQKLAEIIKQKVTDKRKLSYEQPWPYNPHLTVAFKDLTYEGFIKAKHLLEKKEFSAEIIIDHVSIVKKQLDGIFKEFKEIIIN